MSDPVTRLNGAPEGRYAIEEMKAEVTTVVMVHGTFAQDDCDHGDRWWQRGSSFWNSLADMLPDGVSLPSEDEPLFHWSGENSWSERFHGALSLLEYLRALDERGIAYHVIAHSHGGTVLWEALRLSVEKPQYWKPRRPLKGLRTWTTVGTPFPTARSTIRDWARVLSGPVGLVLLFLAPGLISLLRGEENIPLAVPVSMFLLVPLFELGSLRREARAGARAAAEYGGRWRGLFSRHDEAISGLATAVALRFSLPKKRALNAAVYRARPNLALLEPIHRAKAFLYNLLVRRWAQSFVTSLVRGAAIGNDRPGVTTWMIGTAPPGLPAPQALSDDVESELLGIADTGSSSVVRALRRELRTDGSTFSPANLTLTEPGLVHTSYFECSDFRDQLGEVIRGDGS